MNNNRLSSVTRREPTNNETNREDLEFKVKNFLAAPSNLKLKDGIIYILSEQRYINSGKNKPINNTLSLINQQDESTVRNFLSQAECAKYFCVSESTISNRLKKGLTFNHDGKLVLLRKKGKD